MTRKLNNDLGLMGGARKGAGRPVEVVNSTSISTLIEGGQQIYLDKVKRTQGLTSRAAAVRYLLDICRDQGVGLAGW